SAFCPDRSVTLTGSGKNQWNGWSPAAANTRYQLWDAAGLNLGQVSRLQLKWAYGFDGDIIAFSQPAILDGHLFVGSASGLVQDMKADSRWIEWTYEATGPVRSSFLVAPRGEKHAVLCGDSIGWFYAVEAESGRLLWK